MGPHKKLKASVSQKTLLIGQNSSISDRGLISKIYKELKKVGINKPNNPIKYGAQS
jgi:calcineurin-like phosphoesterase